MINAGPFAVSGGLHFGRKHVFVTHRHTGKQWVSKSPMDGHSLQCAADFIITGTITFDPRSCINSCDTRFWTPVRTPTSNLQSEFDSLVFIGD